MAHFSFGNFKVVTKSTNRQYKGYDVIHTKIHGIVIKEENGTIKVKVSDKIYDITEDSYNCKGKKEVYCKNNHDGYGEYICYIRTYREDRHACDKRFTPFRVGYTVIGDLIKEPLNVPKFKIKKCINPYISTNVDGED